MSQPRQIVLPSFTIQKLKREIAAYPEPTLKALYSSPKILFERKGKDPVLQDNPFLEVPIDDVVEALGFTWTLSPPHPNERRRRPPGATCSIRVTEESSSVIPHG
jgi:hypothetical protein